MDLVVADMTHALPCLAGSGPGPEQEGRATNSLPPSVRRLYAPRQPPATRRKSHTAETQPSSLLTRSSMSGHPEPFRLVRDLGRVPACCSRPSGIPEDRSPRWLPAWLAVAEDLADRLACCGPSAFQAGHIPSCYGSCDRYALSPVAAVGRWSLLLLSPLLSAQLGHATGTSAAVARERLCPAPGIRSATARTLQRMAPYPWPGCGPGPWFLASVAAEARCQVPP